MIYLNPRPSKKEIGDYYPSKTYYSYQPIERRGLRDKIASLTRKSAPGYSQNLPIYKRLLMKSFFKLFSSRVVIVPFKNNGKILDIGCGSGVFLKEMNDLGWDSYGVDIDKLATEYANSIGLKVFWGEISDAHYPAEFFDVVTIKSTIEHLHNPFVVLNEVNRILKKDGVLILATPNIDCYEAKIFGRFWSHLSVPQHLYFFSLDTLTDALQKSGFSVQKVDMLVLDMYIFPQYHLINSLGNMRSVGNKSWSTLSSALLKWLLIQSVLCLFSKNRGKRFGSVMNIYAAKK